jgi:hypothetical protein
MNQVFKDIDAILTEYKVKGFKVTDGEMIAIRKNHLWYYFRWNCKENGLMLSGETDRYERRW